MNAFLNGFADELEKIASPKSGSSKRRVLRPVRIKPVAPRLLSESKYNKFVDPRNVSGQIPVTGLLYRAMNNQIKEQPSKR